MEPHVVHRAVAARAILPQELQSQRHRSYAWFYSIMAMLAALAVLAGFFPTYFRPMASGGLDIPSIVHLHAGLFLTWTLLFVVQPLLVRAGSVRRHRQIGVVGAGLAAAMLLSGITVALGSSARSVSSGDAEAGLAFLLITLTDMLLFGVLVSVALIHRRRPQTHKRLMLLATAALLPAAFGRLAFFGFGIEHPLAMHIGADAFLLAGVVFDLLHRGRIHRAYVWGGGFLIAVHALRLLLAESAAWAYVASRILNLVM